MLLICISGGSEKWPWGLVIKFKHMLTVTRWCMAHFGSWLLLAKKLPDFMKPDFSLPYTQYSTLFCSQQQRDKTELLGLLRLMYLLYQCVMKMVTVNNRQVCNIDVMVIDRENRCIWRDFCSISTLSTINPKRIGLAMNLDIRLVQVWAVTLRDF